MASECREILVRADHRGLICDASSMQSIYWFGFTEGPYRHRPPAVGAFCCQGAGFGLDRKTERMAVAVHEAGHALAAFTLGVHVPAVSIREQEGILPCGHPYDVTGELDEVRLAGATVKQGMTVLVSGERAEDRWLRENGLWTEQRAFFTERGALGDRATARTILSREFGVPLRFGTSAPGAEDTADWWRYHPISDELLTDVWPQVMLLAERVADAGALSGDAAAEVCGLTNPTRPY
ncbi:hypothetical protein [Streptomyces sp. NPDC001165]|uniref:hypothetical protein n=1 Tax=Streptomyces sp. NPDC001165 TaxID=3364546 RepID=UPI003678AE53